MFEIRKQDKYDNPRIIDLIQLKDQIDFEPYYQRYSNIWDVSKKRLLIDTIINGYDIPKFYFHYLLFEDENLNKSNKKFAIIDGKQRIAAILDFLTDEFALDESVKFLKDEKIDLKGKKYSHLKKEPEYLKIKKLIDEYTINVVHIVTDEYERIEEMFLRLNEGVPVNNAEKRNSIGGFLMDGINAYVKNDEFFSHKVRFSNKRMQHQDLMTKFILLEYNNSLISFSKKNLDNLVKKFRIKKGLNENARQLKLQANGLIRTVDNHISFLCKVFKDADILLRTKGIVPLYYWYIRQNKNIKPTIFREFLENFEALREKNRKNRVLDKANRTMLQFDRLNQQGAHLANSLEIRFRIMNFYYNDYLKKKRINPKLELPLEEIGLSKLENQEDDVY